MPASYSNPITHQSQAVDLHCEQLIGLFNACFSESENTLLQSGGEEPLYRPATSGSAAKVIFTRDYFASALHEISHWCVAGKARRELEDYGYWYAPDGRTAEQQQLFEKVEVKPQALEWIFNKACGHQFRVSADNLMAGMGASEEFKRNIVEQAKQYCRQGVNARALSFINALVSHYGTSGVFDPDSYLLAEL